MKILFLTKYSRKGASSRYRTYQYLSYLKQQRIKTDVSPLLGDKYLERLYAGRGISKLYLFKALSKRLFDIFRARRYDLVVIEKELFPFLPPLFEYLLYAINKNMVIDYDDAIFTNYQDKFILRSKIPTVIRLSKAINVGNQYLADYARKFNPNVSLIPTVVDLDKYRPKDTYRIVGKKIVIGWIGTPITSKYLIEVQDALSTLSQRYPILLRCIGTSPDFKIKGVEVENIKWEESTEVSSMLTFDIGIMPLTQDPFSNGKCGLKLIQYMAGAIPSIASSVGANKEIIVDGENGFLTNSTDEWVSKITSLIENPHLREKLGRNGRNTVATRYTLQRMVPKLIDVYKEAAGFKK